MKNLEIKINKETGMTTETNHKLNWYKVFDYDGYLVIEGHINNLDFIN